MHEGPSAIARASPEVVNSMTCATTSASGPYRPLRQLIGHLPQQRLVAGVAPPQGIAPDRARVQIDLAANQPMGPVGIHDDGMPQQANLPGLAGAAQVDDAPAQREGRV